VADAGLRSLGAGLGWLGRTPIHLARRRGARLGVVAAASIAIWLAVLICGRCIAYW
jgi:hypothetical protein